MREDITPLLGLSEYEAIQQTAPDLFNAFISTNRGNHYIGTFETKEEAKQAIRDAQSARWNG